MPPSCSAEMTGLTSDSSRTRSPMAMAWPRLSLKATHDPRASAGFTVTPPAVTVRSPRGNETLYTPPACSEPARPRACSTGFQSAATRKRRAARLTLELRHHGGELQRLDWLAHIGFESGAEDTLIVFRNPERGERDD